MKKTFTRLTDTQIQTKVNFIDQYINSTNAASGSTVDQNANVSSKNIATLEAELNKDINIQVNRKLVYNKLIKLFDKEIADEYIRQLESHEIYCHDENSIKPYCCSISLYPFLLDGLTTLGGESKAPKHLESFCGSFINLIFAISSQFAGAIAAVEFIFYLHYFACKEYGKDYLTTHSKELDNHLQHVVYAINQPAAARGYQSIFFNISLYDKYYFESLFGDFVFPDEGGTKPDFEGVNALQKHFMKWFNKEREKALLTFPVITAAMLTQNNAPKDKDFADMCAEELSEGNSFFMYMSDSADSLASCCFDENQMILMKSSEGVHHMSFKEFKNSKYNDTKRNHTIFHNGSWVKGKLVELDANRDMYKITTANNKEIIVSDNHIHPTLYGDKTTSELTIEDLLLFNNNKLDSFPEKDLNLTYEQGYLIGAYLGDGCFDKTRILANGDSVIYTLQLSLNEKCYEEIGKHINIANEQLGNNATMRLNTPYNNVYPCSLNSKEAVKFIIKWTNWERGIYAHNKELNMDVLLQSYEFRKGILAGWYATDGGNSNRCYTTSKKMAYQMEALITSLGLNSIIDLSDRTNEKVIIRNVEYKRNYPLFCVRWYDSKNKRSADGVYVFKNNSTYFNITSIEKVEYDKEKIYCFEMNNQNEPYFTLPNGIITHNCRLRNDITDNTFSYSLGAGGVATGSINVITINMNRLIQDKRDLKTEIEKVHKYQVAHRTLIQEYKDAGLLTVYDAGYITLEKQFLTIGINGLVEGAEFLGYTISDNQEYKDFVSDNLKVIFDANKEAKKKYGYMFNTEFVPAENLGVKNASWDKKDGYVVPRDCYNSYFYIVEDDSVNSIDKFVLHGKDMIQYLDGGSALHLNLDQKLTKDGFYKLIEVAAKSGCNYWCSNVKITICNSCQHIDKRTLPHCSKCNSMDVDYGTRVIGYLKRISSFSTDRQREAHIRHYHKDKKIA